MNIRMKVLLLLLILSCCQFISAREIPPEENWIDVDPSLATSDPDIHSALLFGAQYVADHLYQDQVLENTNITVTDVFGAQKQKFPNSDPGMYYKFDVYIADSNRNYASAFIYVYSINATNEVIYYDYGTVNVPPDEYWKAINKNLATSDPEIHSALLFGAQYVAEIAKQEQNLENTNVTVTDVFSLQEQKFPESDPGMYYQFHAYIADSNENYIDSYYNVYSINATHEVTLFTYDSDPLPLDEYWIDIDPEVANDDPEIQSALAFGTQYAASQFVKDNLASNSADVNLLEVYSFQEQKFPKSDPGMYYKFSVIYSINSTGNSIYSDFDVYSLSSNITITSFYYEPPFIEGGGEEEEAATEEEVVEAASEEEKEEAAIEEEEAAAGEEEKET